MLLTWYMALDPKLFSSTGTSSFHSTSSHFYFLWPTEITFNRELCESVHMYVVDFVFSMLLLLRFHKPHIVHRLKKMLYQKYEKKIERELRWVLQYWSACKLSLHFQLHFLNFFGRTWLLSALLFLLNTTFSKLLTIIYITFSQFIHFLFLASLCPI